MHVGKQNRLQRIFRPATGNSLMIAVDHGMALGPMKGLEDVGSFVARVMDEIDALFINKGILKSCPSLNGRMGIVLRGSGAATIAGDDLTNEGRTSSAAEALRYGADALGVSVFVATPHEHRTLREFAQAAEECDQWNLPLMAVCAVGKDREKRFDPKFLKLSARVAAENGADLIKTYLPESGFEEMVASCPVPLIIAGGPKAESDEQVLEMTYAAISQGARGVAMGRNVWQSPNPLGIIRALSEIIHNRRQPFEVRELL